MPARNARLRAVFLTFVAILALIVSGCGSEVTGSAQPVAGGLIDATAPTTKAPNSKPSAPTRTKPSAPTGQIGRDTGGDVDFEVAIGECVRLGGTVTDATIDHAACGSNDSNYKVIAKAPTNAQCVSDADSYYYETLGGEEQGALCLDIDWVVGGCMDLSGDDPQRMDCSATTSDGVKVAEIQQNVDDVDGCPTSGGFLYEARRFVVCTDDL
ncbi:LppU family putative lipoprotein [Antrihabitans cavernicola]|uniref:LppU protein n=1 Tax=Antrihabitans cavernicola TaxID=2495913 RepID=A0A5A7S4B8_9NOCA|nr:hypothetical protein [Spelaeibacter cavernicola]KAA0019423.1 hypothetical protein FOY51_22510 [Spelaeibacter cavernicola]